MQTTYPHLFRDSVRDLAEVIKGNLATTHRTMTLYISLSADLWNGDTAVVISGFRLVISVVLVFALSLYI